MAAFSCTLRNLGMNKLESCPKDFMGAVRFPRVRRSPLKWLQVSAGFFLFHFIKSLQAEVLWSEKGRAQPRLLTTSGGFSRPSETSLHPWNPPDKFSAYSIPDSEVCRTVGSKITAITGSPVALWNFRTIGLVLLWWSRIPASKIYLVSEQVAVV